MRAFLCQRSAWRRMSRRCFFSLVACEGVVVVLPAIVLGAVVPPLAAAVVMEEASSLGSPDLGSSPLGWLFVGLETRRRCLVLWIEAGAAASSWRSRLVFWSVWGWGFWSSRSLWRHGPWMKATYRVGSWVSVSAVIVVVFSVYSSRRM